MNETFNHGANRHVAGAEHDIDGFTRHRTSSRASDLIIKNDDWKKGGIRLWLHTRAPIVSVWHHQFFKVIEKREDKSRLPIFFKWNCWEAESVNVDRFKRRRDGSRTNPPCQCPKCKLIELVREAVAGRVIRWTDEVLKFEGDNRADTKLIRAGDFWGAFSSRDLDEDDVADLRRAGVDRKEAWKTALTPKCDYVFCAADADNLGDGCRIIVPPGIMGERMQDAIVREQKRSGKDKGNPLKNPYLFEWSYDDRAKMPKDAYRVDVLGTSPTDEVLKIIRDTDPPDTSDLVAWGDADELRALLEAHALLPAAIWIPMLDKAFPVRDDAPKGGPAPVRDGAKDAPATAGAPPVGTSKAEPDKPPPPPAKEELFDCEHCGAEEVMRATDFDCPKCSAKYVEVGEGEAKATVLGYRPCLSCTTLVAIPGVGGVGKAGDRVKCQKCGAEHFENGEDPPAWVMVEQPKEEPKPAARRRR
jgi:hypothetical protein